MTEREESNISERRLSNGEESPIKTHECDNAWQFKSASDKEEPDKWKMEKERYDEVIEYIREVDEILNLLRPFPREANVLKRPEPLPRSDSQTPSASFGLDHLENIIKLVNQLKEIQESIYKSGERTYYLKDLRKLREHKKKLKTEELLIRSRVRVKSLTSPEDFETCLINRKSSSTSEKLEHEPKDSWQDKRKSICLGENRSKVSKWTKVKEAFHWEKTSPSLRTCKKEISHGEKSPRGTDEEVHSADHSPKDEPGLDLFSSPPSPPPPPPRLPRPENLLSARPAQDLPSSSSSDRLDDFLAFSEMVKENKMSDPDSPGHPFGADDIEEVETATRKSSCEELTQHLSKEEFAASRSLKSNRTAWGKVKDIIQTRKDSLKKKPKKRGSDEFKKRRKLSTVSNPQFSDQFEDLSSPEEKIKNAEIIPKTGYDLSEEALPTTPEDKCPKRLTPALTITLPSTEELRSFSSDEADKRDVSAEGNLSTLTQFSCQAQYSEDKWKFAKNKLGSNQRFSRWIKVKRVFLTSGTPAQSPQYLPVSSSSPSSQNKSCGFFSDMESDDLSSGEWIDEKSTPQEKSKAGYPEPQSTAMTLIQEDIRKSYNELQKKLSQEFDQKLREWEVKSEASVKLEDSTPKIKGDEGDCIPKFRKGRDSIAVPLPNLNDLSPEFKKKLSDWKKMKTSQSSSSMSSSATKDDIQGQNLKIRIGEWQPWRSRCSGKGAGKNEQGAEDCSRKPDDAQKGCGGSRPPAIQKKEEEGGFAGSVSRRGSKRRDSMKKVNHSRTSSGGESVVSANSAEKDGRFIRKSQKLKNFHWVEKELQKIEREKLRLEQEKEKYLEREARLEKMKKTMGASPTQEILVRTPEGFVRFKGISQKFTKKLYEWEKARNIAPEASTFALLEESAQTGASGDSEGDAVTMHRSKSTGSVPELTSALLIQTMAHHPSSLSLNDVDELKTREEVEEETSLERIKDYNEEPEAVIVDIEDIVEETGVLEDPSFREETPVYTYTSEEIYEPREFRGRFFISDGLDIKIIEEGGTGSCRNNAEMLNTLPDAGECCRDAIMSLKNSESRINKSFLESTEDEKIMSIKDSTRRVQDIEEERETSEDPFQSLAAPNSECRNSKTKEKKSEKTEISGGTEPEIHVPTLGKSSQEAFSQCINGVENTIRLSSDRQPHQLSFAKKSVQSSGPKKTDPELLKKKIKEKITLMQRMSTEASWKCNDFDFKKTDEKTCDQEEEKAREEPQEDVSGQQLPDSVAEGLGNSGSISVFVPTTRKIISPVKTTEGATPSVCSYVIDDVKPETQERSKQIDSKQTVPPNKPHSNTQDETPLQESMSAPPLLQKKNDIKRDIGMPPLPNSPKMFKKLSPKETAPSIRMIIAKYNQKISEHDNTDGKRNESGSPIWRSPVFGRRTQEKIERYCGNDEGGGKRNGEVQKSASLDSMRTGTTKGLPTSPQGHEAQAKGILKSSSVGIMRVRPQNHEATFISSLPDGKPVLGTFKETSPSVLRALKIQKAKEDFLSGRLGGASDESTVSITVESPPTMAPKNLMVELNEKSEQNLAKSVSAETITVETSGSESHAENMSDGRPLQKSSSKFDISSIKSKFRKIRMRKERDPKLNAVAVLCRQSLFIEVPKASENSSISKSCPSSPVMDRNKHEKSSQPLKK